MRLDFHRNERLLFGTVLVGFIGLSILIAIWPAIQTQMRNEPLPASEPMTKLEKKGLDVYIEQGCVSCHTQQVRPVSVDDGLGRPSVPGDFARLKPMNTFEHTPALLGSERTGPDLTNIGQRQPSKTWHMIHLYQPRAVVEESIMPAFPWLFRIEEEPSEDATVVPVPEEYAPSGGKVVAGEEAEALVAYLKSLKQPPLPERFQDKKESTKKKEAGGKDEKSGEKKTADLGQKVYSNKCASCHQANGKGVPGTFPPLAGDPVVTAKDPTEHVDTIVNGLQGKTIQGTDYAAAMPPFGGQLSAEELAAVVNHERTSWGNDAPTVTVEEVKELIEKVSD
jgi:cytochrome c oxidase cbb3-type subunit 2